MSTRQTIEVEREHGTAEETALLFMGALAVEDWSGALAVTQVSWRHGFDPRAAQGVVKRWLSRFVPSMRPSPTATPDDVREVGEFLRIERVLRTAPPIMTSAMLAAVPVLVVRRSDKERFPRTYSCWHLVMCVREEGPFRPSPNGVWGANPVSATRRVTRTEIDALRKSVVDRALEARASSER